ncbi:unnamed protein product [Dovyalis caffra]|uniref:cytochrome-c oxidase n=1 Tax=Dovyalis caffra TaxID=77055 RepID=A0AAV1R8B2_9ROSI|nr:unnamed protein product [Dovyalis caffra]
MELSQPVFDSRIDSSSTSGIDELEEQAERENRDRGNEFHCHPLLQLSARLPVKEVRGMPSSKKAASSVFSGFSDNTLWPQGPSHIETTNFLLVFENAVKVVNAPRVIARPREPFPRYHVRSGESEVLKGANNATIFCCIRERPRMQRALSQTQGVWDMAWSLAYECEERASLLASRLKLHLQARLESKGTWVRSNNPTLACLPEPALHTDFRWFLVLVRFSSSSSKALHSQELARCGNIVQSSSSEPSVNQGPERNGADAGPSGTPSSSSWEEDSFGLRVLEESSYGTDTSREGPLEQAAIPFPPANPVASPEAAQEALPQAPAPAEAAHPVPNQEEVAALRRELHVLIQEQIRAESERGRGPLSTQFPEQREFNSEAAHNLMAQLELSGETDTDSLREWAERIRGDPSLLKPLIVPVIVIRLPEPRGLSVETSTNNRRFLMVFPLLTAALFTPPDIWCQIVARFLISLIIELAIFVASIVQVREEARLSFCCVPGIMVYKNRLPFRSGIGYLSQGVLPCLIMVKAERLLLIDCLFLTELLDALAFDRESALPTLSFPLIPSLENLTSSDLGFPFSRAASPIPYPLTEPWQLGFQDAASPMMQGIMDLHHDLFFFLILILVFVLWILVGALWHFHYKKNPIPQRIVHGTTIEILWTIFPSLILMFIAIPSFALLYAMDEVVVDPAITMKAIGHQWYWTYEYSDYNSSDEESLTFDSYMIPEDDLELGQLRLLEVDNRLVVPANSHLRLLVTSADVLHSWAVPSLGVKCDAVPGRLNQISILVQREGVYYGQCSEICGTNHAFMPIVVEALSLKDYCDWVDIHQF